MAGVKAGTKKTKSKSTKKAEPKTLRELFTSARQWMKNQMRDGHGRYCLVGGLQRVYGDNPGRRLAMRSRLCQHLPSQYRATRNIVAFNDAPTTTFADIRRLIVRARV
jgi:hypothetical protein